MMKILVYRRLLALLALFAVLFFWQNRAQAHCDTLDGPVVKTAQSALETGDVTPVVKWVSVDDEPVIRDAFQKTLKVRQLGDQARELADTYFFETLVRIHRAGEGAPYTGLKAGGRIDPAVALADKAIENGNADNLSKVLTRAIEKGIRNRFERVMQTGRLADEGSAAGRAFVAAYVEFTHYAEGIHEFIRKGVKPHGHP